MPAIPPQKILLIGPLKGGQFTASTGEVVRLTTARMDTATTAAVKMVRVTLFIRVPLCDEFRLEASNRLTRRVTA